MARAMTRIAMASDSADWIIMVSLAHRQTGKGVGGAERGGVGVGRVQVVRIGRPPPRRRQLGGGVLGKGEARRDRRAGRPLGGPAAVELPVPQAEHDHVLDPDGRAPAQQRRRGDAPGRDQDVVGQDGHRQDGAGGNDDQQGDHQAVEGRRAAVDAARVLGVRSPSRTSWRTGPIHQPGIRPPRGVATNRIVAATTGVAIGQRGSASRAHPDLLAHGVPYPLAIRLRRRACPGAGCAGWRWRPSARCPAARRG